MLKKKGHIQGIAAMLLMLICSESIAQNDTPPSATVASKQQSGVSITGVVKDGASGKTAPGIQISVVGYSAAITDDKGSFSIRVPDYYSTIQVSGEGFQTRLVPLKGRNTIEVVLDDASIKSLYEFVAMPSSTLAKSNLSASVSTPDESGSWTRPFETLDGMLQGKVAGLNAEAELRVWGLTFF